MKRRAALPVDVRQEIKSEMMNACVYVGRIWRLPASTIYGVIVPAGNRVAWAKAAAYRLVIGSLSARYTVEEIAQCFHADPALLIRLCSKRRSRNPSLKAYRHWRKML